MTAVSLTTSTQAAALGYAPQNKIATLCDGSLLWVDESGTSSNTARLYQITNPASATPTNTQVTGFTPSITSMIQSDCDIFVVNTGSTSSEVWVALGGQAGAAGVLLLHATYTASGAVWSAWTSTTVPGVGNTAGDMTSVVWTGTYLIVAWRDNASSAFTNKINYTTDHTGTTGWQASSIKLNTDAGTASHHYIALHYDATIGATIATMIEQTGANGTEFIVARVLPDTLGGSANPPALTNWGSVVQLAGVTGVNVGSGNFAHTFDHTTGRLHVAWCDSVVTAGHYSPGYATATVTVDTTTLANNVVTWGSPVAVVAATTAAAQPSMAVDGSGTVYFFWQVAAVNTAGTIHYVTIPSPFTTPSAATTLTIPASITAQYYVHVPNRERVTSAFLPVIYQTGTASPYGIYYDNGISLVVNVAATGTAAGTATGTGSPSLAIPASAGAGGTTGATATASLDVAATAAGAAVSAGSATATVNSGTAAAGAANGVSGATATASLAVPASADGDGVSTAGATAAIAIAANATAGATAVGSAVASVSGGPAAGTGIGGLAVGTQTVTWANGGSGTATTISYTDATNSGWTVMAVPTYGGAIISPWDEVNAGAATANQTSMSTTTGSTTNPDGWTHILAHHTTNIFAGGAYDGSETYPYNNAGSFTELAPTGTDFRRMYKALVNNGVAVDNLVWTVQTCIYPGDPGLVVDRIDVQNTSASALTLSGTDALTLCAVAGLVSDTASPAGPWNWANAHYGQKGALSNSFTNHDVAQSITSVNEPDYFYITPNAGSGQYIGVGAVKYEKLVGSGMNWSSPTIEVYQNTNRVKIVWAGAPPSTQIPANTTLTFHVLKALRRNISGPFMSNLALDFLTPGTPTSVGPGSFSAFRVDERAYEFAATAHLTATLDLTGVPVRYKPVIKVTGWTSAQPPRVTFGGTTLIAGTDFRWTYDSTNSVLYVQLYFDIVPSAATGGQRVNGAMDITPTAINADGSAAASSGATATAGVLETATAAAAGTSTATGTVRIDLAVSGTVSGQSGASAVAATNDPEAATAVATSTAVATASLAVPASGSVSASTTAQATGGVAVPASGSSGSVSTAGATAGVTTQVSVAGTGSATSGASATPAVAVPATGAGVAVAGGTGVATLDAKVNGTAAGVSGATGTAGQLDADSAQANGISTAQAVPTLSAPAQGAGAGVSIAGATASVGIAAVATAGVTSAATATSSVITGTGIIGTAQATSTAQATATMLVRSVGVAAGVGDGVGVASLAARVQGRADAVADGAATAGQLDADSAQANGISTAQGVPTLAVSSIGTSAAASGAAATATIGIAAAGASASVTGGSATAGITQASPAIASAVSGATATAAIAIAASAGAVGTTTATATAVARGSGSASADGVSAAFATATLQARSQGATAGTTTAQGTALITWAGNGAAVATATAFATPAVTAQSQGQAGAASGASGTAHLLSPDSAQADVISTAQATASIAIAARGIASVVSDASAGTGYTFPVALAGNATPSSGASATASIAVAARGRSDGASATTAVPSVAVAAQAFAQAIVATTARAGLGLAASGTATVTSGAQAGLILGAGSLDLDIRTPFNDGGYGWLASGTVLEEAEIDLRAPLDGGD